MISFAEIVATERLDGSDRASIASCIDGRVRLDPIPAPPTVPDDSDWILLPAWASGLVDVLVHEESDDFAGLRQLHIRGTAAGDAVIDPAVTGSLAPSPKRAIRSSLSCARSAGSPSVSATDLRPFHPSPRSFDDRRPLPLPRE